MRMSIVAAVAAAAIGLVPASLAAQGDALTRDDRAMIVRELEESNKAFQASVAGLSEAQWRFKPAPTRWSIAEVAEHLALVDQGLGGMALTALQPIPPFSADSAAKLEAGVRGLYGDRTRRFNSPEGFVPAGQWATQAELMTAYNEARAANLEYARSTADPLRARGGPHPAFGPLDGVHWMVVIAAHMNRHIQQIEDVKKAEGYPGR